LRKILHKIAKFQAFSKLTICFDYTFTVGIKQLLWLNFLNVKGKCEKSFEKMKKS